MTRAYFLFSVCYCVDLIVFYAVRCIFPGQNVMLAGIYKVRMEVLYDYAYLFLFFIVAMHLVIYAVAAAGVSPKKWFITMLCVLFSYPIFVVMSSAVVSFAKNVSFLAVTIDGLAAGLFIIIFSPMTYVILVTHFIILNSLRKRRCSS